MGSTCLKHLMKRVRFDDTVTVYEYVSDKEQKREERMEMIIIMLESLFNLDDDSDDDDETTSL